MTQSSNIVERRARVEQTLFASQGRPITISGIAVAIGEPSAVVKADIQWLRKTQGMVIEHLKRDVVLFKEYDLARITVNTDKRAMYPMLGLCDWCNRVIKLDGRNHRFCSEECRTEFASQNAEDMQTKRAQKERLVGTMMLVDPLSQAAADDRLWAEQFFSMLEARGEKLSPAEVLAIESNRKGIVVPKNLIAEVSNGGSNDRMV